MGDVVKWECSSWYEFRFYSVCWRGCWWLFHLVSSLPRAHSKQLTSLPHCPSARECKNALRFICHSFCLVYFVPFSCLSPVSFNLRIAAHLSILYSHTLFLYSFTLSSSIHSLSSWPLSTSVLLHPPLFDVISPLTCTRFGTYVKYVYQYSSFFQSNAFSPSSPSPLSDTSSVYWLEDTQA